MLRLFTVLGLIDKLPAFRPSHDDARPSASGPTTDSVCTSERLPTPDGSELSLPGSNPPLQFYYPHDTILEEDLLSLPPPYQSSTRLRSSLISRHGAPDDSSDTSSEVSCGRQVYHRPTMHPNDAAPHPRRYMRSADHRASVHRSIRSLSDASRVSSLGYRGHADGRSELDASSYSKSLELSNPELRYYGPVRVTKIHGQSHESLPPVFVRSSASMARDSGLGPSEFGRSSCHSRRSSTSSQVTYVGRPSPSPMRRDSASSRESTSFPVNGGKLSAKRERKAYDSTSSECSSSRDELMSALEFGKRHNLDRYYGIPTLETTSASSEATNTSSDLDGVCRFSASPRLHGHGCLAPIPVRPPPFNPRSRSRGSENYMYVPRGMSRDFVYVGAHNGSLVWRPVNGQRKLPAPRISIWREEGHLVRDLCVTSDMTDLCVTCDRATGQLVTDSLEGHEDFNMQQILLWGNGYKRNFTYHLKLDNTGSFLVLRSLCSTLDLQRVPCLELSSSLEYRHICRFLPARPYQDVTRTELERMRRARRFREVRRPAAAHDPSARFTATRGCIRRLASGPQGTFFSFLPTRAFTRSTIQWSYRVQLTTCSWARVIAYDNTQSQTFARPRSDCTSRFDRQRKSRH